MGKMERSPLDGLFLNLSKGPTGGRGRGCEYEPCSVESRDDRSGERKRGERSGGTSGAEPLASPLGVGGEEVPLLGPLGVTPVARPLLQVPDKMRRALDPITT